MTMTTEHSDPLTVKVQRDVARAARSMLRKELRDMRVATQARARARRLETRRKFELGEAVLIAGLVDWQAAEITGLLLDGKDRYGSSPTMRLGLSKRGAAHLAGAPQGLTTFH